MSAPGAGVDRPTLRVRGTPYPVLLPTLRDPRLHLAAVIVTLQVLGQVAFEFRLSIAQILVSLAVAGVLEFALAFRRQRVIMWPASALLTGNGVAFVLRVPGTEHGDWWSMNGWWIFAATSAVALLSKYLVRIRGRHVFNPSNFGLVLCFLLLGSAQADPLALWWGPLSPALVSALALIVVGGFLILRRLRLGEIAVGFWLAFAAGIGVLSVSGHTMTAPWHVGPIEGAEFWWLLVTSPEILVFLFFMITDPKTIPAGRAGRRAYAVGVGLLATILIAPQTTEYATKVAILAALALVCAARGVVELLGASRLSSLADRRPRRRVVGGIALAAALGYAGLVVAAGFPARPEGRAPSAADTGALPAITVADTPGIAAIGEDAAQTIARDVLAGLDAESDALRLRDRDRAEAGASGAWLASVWQQIGATSGRTATVASYDVDRMHLRMQPSGGQGPPHVVARLEGTLVASEYGPGTETLASGRAPEAFRRTVELVLERGRYRIVSSEGGLPLTGGRAHASPRGTLGGTTFVDVASRLGVRFRHGAFRFGMSFDTTAMMGGGVCWLDYDDDGWLDLFAVNSYADVDIGPYDAHGGLPRSALFRNDHGRFVDVSSRAGADLPLRGNGCVAADFDLDGHTDLYVTSAGYNVPTDGWDALLWNNGDGTFTEGAQQAGIDDHGWHAGAAVGDVNGDGRPDLFVASYTDVNVPVASSSGFPGDHLALRDALYLNEGPGVNGRPTFRNVARRAGIERRLVGHGLGAVLTDVDGDGRLDLYVANDTDPNQLYRNVADATRLGFHFEEIAGRDEVDDPNAGMGIAAADFSRDGRVDLFVTNSRDQLHAAYRSQAPGRPFVDARPEIAALIGTDTAGWGDSWADFDLDGDLDLALANGAIPVVSLAKDARRVRVLENVAGPGAASRFGLVGPSSGLDRLRRINGRGLAVADFDNDGDPDIAVNSVGGRLMLLENRSHGGHWLEVRLPSFAPGAVVTAVLPGGRRLVREVQAGSSYLSSEDPRPLFGLGATSVVDELVVRYPDGTTTRLRDVAADRIVEVGGARP
jgi:ASPIC and UnbV/FG-GAP-like repeat/NQR2, RnfD, RnfE family